MSYKEMPRYKCHKQVWALKIKSVEPNGDSQDSYIITPEENDYVPFSVDEEYYCKHNPKVGGYYVVYDDGYKSFSPKNAFENGYTRI